MIFPWQQKQWQQLNWAIHANRLPHALCLTGLLGMGKLQFAESFARRLLCDEVTANEAVLSHCDCHACHLFLNRTHPNLFFLSSNDDESTLKIEHIRALNEWASKTALQHKYKIVIINDVHQLNVNAANALLKTLEEPAKNTLFLLITHQENRLPETILSRCQKLHFPLPPKAMARQWLKTALQEDNENIDLRLSLAHGVPFAAMTIRLNDAKDHRKKIIDALFLLMSTDVDPLDSAAALHQIDNEKWLAIMLIWTLDLLRLTLGATQKNIVNQDYFPSILQLSKQISQDQLLQIIQLLQEYQHQCYKNININNQLALERVMIALKKMRIT